MRNPIDDETEIIVRFASRRQHEAFAHETGAGSRFIYRETEDGRVQVLCRLDRNIMRYGEWISNPMFLDKNGKPARSVRLTTSERRRLEMR